MQDKQQIYGRNDMVMLYKHNKILTKYMEVWG